MHFMPHLRLFYIKTELAALLLHDFSVGATIKELKIRVRKLTGEMISLDVKMATFYNAFH